MTVHDFSARTIAGNEESLAKYRGQVLLIVNVASRCGYTPQYQGLQALQDAHGAQGFNVLGFPCDQFGNQEPGTEVEIAQFCKLNYGVTFPLYAKIEVNGDVAHPLYRFLKTARPGILGSEKIKWNFTKFLVGRDGQVLARYAPRDTPDSIDADIRAALA
jgi:glutathione peroxidase